MADAAQRVTEEVGEEGHLAAGAHLAHTLYGLRLLEVSGGVVLPDRNCGGVVVFHNKQFR